MREVGPRRGLTNEEVNDRQLVASRLSRYLQDEGVNSQLDEQIEAAKRQLESEEFQPQRDAIGATEPAIAEARAEVAAAEQQLWHAQAKLRKAIDVRDSANRELAIATKEITTEIDLLEKRKIDLRHEEKNCVPAWRHTLIQYSRWLSVIWNIEQALRESHDDETLNKGGCMLDRYIPNKLEELRNSVIKSPKNDVERQRNKDIESTIFQLENRLERFYKQTSQMEAQLAAVKERAVNEVLEEAGYVEAAISTIT